LNLQHIHVQL
jgi:hypothetical protein